jgi:hypothetical protein
LCKIKHYSEACGSPDYSTASTLMLRNLHDVFGEIDPVRRRSAIDEIYREDAVFHEPNGIYRGRDEIDHIAGVIQGFAS